MKKKGLEAEAGGVFPGPGLFPVLVALVTVLVFSRSFSGGFVSLDDTANFLQNSAYRGLGWAQLRWMATTTLTGVYQPLAWLTLGLDYRLWGMNPFGYHLTSVLIHSANAALYYFLSLRLLERCSPQTTREERLRTAAISACAALGFALHPLRVESVAWITERRDVLSGFFYLSAILAYLSRKRRERAGAGALPVIFFSASLLAKGSGLGLPATLLALDVFPLKRLSWHWRSWLTPEARPVLKEKIPFLLLSAAAAGAGIVGQKSAGNFLSLSEVGVSARGMQIFLSIAFYLRKTVMPTFLMPDYERPRHFMLLTTGNAFAMAVAIVFLILIVAQRARRPALTAAGVHYLAALVPVIGVFQFGANVVADRYSYIPCLCWPILAAGFISVSWEGFSAAARASARSIAVLALAVLGLMTWRQIGIWHDSDALWNYVLTLQPDNALANNNRGADLERQARTGESAAYFQRSLAAPTPEAYSNLADILAGGGRFDEAEKNYKAALALAPNSAPINSKLGLLYARENGRLDEAIVYLRRALAEEPADAAAHNNLGLALASRGSPEEALKEYRESVRLKPTSAAYNNIANALFAGGRLDEAGENYRAALGLDPENAQIHFNLGLVFTRRNRFEQAVAQYRRALELDGRCVPCRINIAYALAASGHPEEALSYCREALRLDPSSAPAQRLQAGILAGENRDRR